MLRFLLFGGSVLGLMLSPAPAQIRKFPYEGLVESDAAYVRSGPGKQFYPTGQLGRGARITVHRHDPGGWYMIAPPPGSFSWIRAEYVQKTAANRGIITQNNVVVRVGSAFGDETREVEQVRLSKNDQVQILEEKVLSTSSGQVPHYKITPPAGEYRWVSGKYITPVNQIVRQQQDKNPFAVPSQAKQAPPTETNPARTQTKPSQSANLNVFESSRKPAGTDPAVRRSGPDPNLLSAQHRRLEELDKAFRTMVNGRTEDWSFTGLEQGYRQLQQEAALPALASQIDLRFNAISRYRKIKEEYDALVELTTESRQRDAQLMAIQKERRSPGPSPTPVEEEPLVPVPDPFAQKAVPDPVELPGVEPIEPKPEPTRGQQPQSAPQSRNVQRAPRFDGAGIVQRAATAGTGTPAYVLITPQGRVLAYLQPAGGLNLEPYVGKAMGIYGQRSYRPDLRMDAIIVRSLTPVRLAP